MPRSTLRLCSIVLAAAVATYAGDTKNRWSQYRRAVITPRSVASNAAGAGIAQARDATPEWGQGMAGYAKRFGSRIAHHAVKGTIQFGVSAWRHESMRYQPSGLEGNWPRLKYSVVHTFWVPRTDGSGNTMAVGMVAGNFGGAAISRAWHPVATRTVGSAVAGGFFGIGLDTTLNIVREFWPWRKFKP